MGFRFPPSLFFHRRAPGPQLLAGVRATLELALDTVEGQDTRQRAAEMGQKLRATLGAEGEATKAKDWLVEYLQKPIAPKGSRATAYGLKRPSSPYKASLSPSAFTPVIGGRQRHDRCKSASTHSATLAPADVRQQRQCHPASSLHTTDGQCPLLQRHQHRQ